jgi:hypothetical protein
MYRRPKFLEILHEIRAEMSRETDYDMDLFAESIRSGKLSRAAKAHLICGAPPPNALPPNTPPDKKTKI